MGNVGLANEEDTPETPYIPDEPVFDESLALSHVEGDTELFRRVIELFLEDAPVMMSEVREAVVSRDPAGLARSRQVRPCLEGRRGSHRGKACRRSRDSLGANRIIRPD